ncbi:MAG TPA: hypothetical protein DEB24_00510 [Coriobacteriia bacterium]|nr:hypothetical protein [Coriobacteriia bacterium]
MKNMTDVRSMAESCSACGACTKNCLFLQRYVKSPRKYFEQALSSTLDTEDRKSAFYCMVCGSCKAVCPKNLDPGRAFLAVRGDIVTDNGGAIPIESLKSVNNHQKLSFSALLRTLKRGRR